MSHIPVQIEKVMELEGVYGPNSNYSSSVYAHVSMPLKKEGQSVQYVMIAIFPRHGTMPLGDINPVTKRFEHYDPDMNNLALYTRADNHVVTQVSIPVQQLERLKTLDDVLAIEGISIKRELIPN